MLWHGEKNKKLQYPPASMNFGITVRPQEYGLEVKKPSGNISSIPMAVLPLYSEEFAGVYIKRTTRNSDRYHKNRRGCARLRQTFSGEFHQIPLNLVDTYTTTKSKKKVNVGVRRLAVLENKIRSVSEYIMAVVFHCLPYGTVPFIAYDNVDRAAKRVKGNNREYFPVPRVFPKGTLGMYQTKTLHDDDNGAISPSLWSSIVGDDNTYLSFHGVNFEVKLVTSTFRFCWFMGWIPHKTTTTTTGRSKKMARINHSAYTKPEFEQFANALLHQNCYRECMSTLKIKKNENNK